MIYGKKCFLLAGEQAGFIGGLRIAWKCLGLMPVVYTGKINNEHPHPLPTLHKHVLD